MIVDQPIIAAPAAPRRLRKQAGYVPLWPAAYRLYNVLMAVGLLVALAPLFAGFAIALRLSQGPDVLVRARRLGRHEKPFTLYRFASVGVVPQTGRLRATMLGRYLRQTGLDGLPQLFNVIKGDMNIIGPRPVREAIARIEAARDPLYVQRFAVKPGLIGYEDVTVGETVGQRVKSKFTYRLCRTAVNLPLEMLLTLRIAAIFLTDSIRFLRRRPTPQGHLRRARRKAQDLHLQLETATGRYPIYALSQGLLTSPHVVTGGPARIIVAVGAGQRTAKVELSRLSHLQGETVFQYDAVNDHAAHLICRYLRGETLFQPAQPTWRRPRVADLQYEIDLHDPRPTVPVEVPRR